MEEIKVGEYVRTKKGSIGKFKFTGADDTDNIIVYFKNQYGTTCVDETEIVKHSFNIIDLIEVGDYVNGEKITRIIPPDICGDEVLENARIFTETKEIYESDIKSIVTKEQFESIKYKVGD